VILSRNRADRLRSALDAARDGARQPDDLLVSDDSDDSIRPAIRRLADEYGARYAEGPRVGLGANENSAVANLLPEAEWVVFTGDDARVADTFFAEAESRLSALRGRREVPTGIEYRNGELVRPNRLDFLGYQSIPHADYTPGAEVETVVVQATPFPADGLRQLSWLEVSTYGYDEVDMVRKMRRLGWRFVFEPSLRVHHDQSPIGRNEYPAPAELARLYVRLRTYSVYEQRPVRLVAFLALAPCHLLAVKLRRRDWRGALEAVGVVVRAYRAWMRSLRGDWRRT
jgi:hypothetical protein